MNIYHYDNATGEYLGSGEAKLDPIDQLPLIPAQAVIDAPPPALAGFAIVRYNDVWQVVPDKRGETYYETDRTPVEIETLGQEVGLLAVVTPFTQIELDEQAVAVFKQSRAAAVQALTVTTVSGKVFDGDETSQNRMARAVVASSPGDTTMWVLANNIPTSVTHEELKEALGLAGTAQTALWSA